MTESLNRDFKLILIATVVCSLVYLMEGLYSSAWGTQAGFIVGLVGYWAQVPQWTDNSWDWYQYDESADESERKAA